jgi:hypothetical protein
MQVGKIAVLLGVLGFLGTCGYVAADCRVGDRYEVSGTSGTVTDCRTGLIWLKNAKCTDTSNSIANPGGFLNWYNAQKWVAGLQDGLCGLTDGSIAGDWRLPTKTEWMAMVAYARYTHSPAYENPALTNDAGTAKWSSGGGSSFTALMPSSCYWSSTTYADNTALAWQVRMGLGDMDYYWKSTDCCVWPVRGGQSGSFGTLRIE